MMYSVDAYTYIQNYLGRETQASEISMACAPCLILTSFGEGGTSPGVPAGFRKNTELHTAKAAGSMF